MTRTKADELEREKSDSIIDIVRDGKKIVVNGKVVEKQEIEDTTINKQRR